MSAAMLSTVIRNGTILGAGSGLPVTVIKHKHLSLLQQIIITFCYVAGIFGNLVALILLCKKSLRSNNPKHNLILKCLSANDLAALMGMMVLMYLQLYVTSSDNIWLCRTRVMWRVFGLGSGCVAIVMAVERWLALTKPFFYQKHVTLMLLRRCIFTLWSFAVLLVCMPFFGYGLYYDAENIDKKCLNYKEAKTPVDVAYAYFYFAIGLSLCIGIVFCNVAVMRTLCFKGYTYTNNTAIRVKKPIFIRRMSRSFSRMSTASTREEIAFGRLMAFLCVVFVICWLPQLCTIPLHQMRPNDRGNPYYRIADMLMALHFTLNPYIYVLQRSSAFRKLFCSHRTHYTQHNNSVRMISFDQPVPYLAKA